MTCPDCGTDHDGHPPGSLGAAVRCLRVQADALGATHVEAQLDQFDAELAGHRDRALAGYFAGDSIAGFGFAAAMFPHVAEGIAERVDAEVAYAKLEAVGGRRPDLQAVVDVRWEQAKKAYALSADPLHPRPRLAEIIDEVTRQVAAGELP